jgi:ribonuclease VapC
MTVVNVGEVWYIIAREASEADADRSFRDMQQLGIKFIDADWDLTHQAAQFKSKHRMSFADCFAAALAKEKKAHLVTGDQEFREVQGDISIIWV